MVEIAELTIGTSINTEDVESGLTRVGQGFDLVESKASGVNADFARMAATGKRLRTLFIGMGLAGGTAMIVLAKNAPAVAGSMAQIQVEAGKLERSMGRILAPAFDFAADSFAGFVGVVQDHEGTLGIITSFFTEEVRSNWEDAGTIFGFVKDKIKELSSEIGLDGDKIKDFLTMKENIPGGFLLSGTLFNPLGQLADIIRNLKSVDQNDSRRTIGQILKDWI